MANADTIGEEFSRIISGVERETDASADSPHVGPAGWRSVPWIEGGGAANPGLWAERLAWLDLGDEVPAAEMPTPPPPDHDGLEATPVVCELGPADPAAISNELGLARARNVRELLGIRRTFALRNHPDLFPAALCELATQRMRIANILIDEALQRRRAAAYPRR